MSRFAVALTSFLGTLGFALAMAYLLLVFRAFAPGSPAVTEFLIGKGDADVRFGFLLFAIPYILLMAHLWLRIRVGEWLLERGDVEAAASYSRRRMRPNPLRARKEALAHRNVVGRVHLRRGEYDAAWSVLTDADRVGRSDPWAADHWRWRLETALRRENLVDANHIADLSGAVKVRGPQMAALQACLAELRIREGDAAAADAALDSARWAHPGPLPRVALAYALRVQRFGADAEELRAAIERLDLARAWLNDLPAAEGDFRALEADLLIALGEREKAAIALGSFDETWDARSKWRWSQHRSEESDE